MGRATLVVKKRDIWKRMNTIYVAKVPAERENGQSI